ncbi:MAG: OpgC domain-containing protein, partial [Methylobacterium sp.]
VNHVPGITLEQFTTRNFGFSDSAELFVFLAGFASAFAYGRGFLTRSRLVFTLKAMRRAGVLYLVHITLTMLAVSLFALVTLATGDGRYMMQLGLGTFMTQPLDALAGVALLGHQLAYLNILPLYCVLLLLVPLQLAIARRFGLAAMLVASGALWLAAGLWRLNLPSHPDAGGWHFAPFAWQFVFAIGLACGLARLGRQSLVPFRRALYVAAALYLAGAYGYMALALQGAEQALPLPAFVRDIDKTFVSPARLLHLLALVYVFAHAPASSPFQRIAASNPLARLGRHALPVFATGTMLSLVCQIARLDRDNGPWMDVALIALGIALQFALAAFLDWWRQASAALSGGDARTGNRIAEPDEPERALAQGVR